jgi:hypothetical protein
MAPGLDLSTTQQLKTILGRLNWNSPFVPTWARPTTDADGSGHVTTL